MKILPLSEFGMFLDYYRVEIVADDIHSLSKESVNPVQLLYFSSGADRNQKRLETAVKTAIPESQIEVFKRLEDFGKRLRLPIEPDSIAVLSAADRDELLRMQQLRWLLSEIFVVLVVPDREEGTIRLAHLLLPRFLSQQEDTFIDLGKVLAKIYRTAH
jgi:hypothetical protein